MSTQERMKILEMIAEGQISAEEAARLLDAAGSAVPTPEPATAPAAPSPVEQIADTLKSSDISGRRLRVKVQEKSGTRVNVNLPLSLMEVGLKIGGRFVNELEDMDKELQMLMEAVRSDVHGKIVEVDDEDSHVEIYIE